MSPSPPAKLAARDPLCELRVAAERLDYWTAERERLILEAEGTCTQRAIAEAVGLTQGRVWQIIQRARDARSSDDRGATQ